MALFLILLALMCCTPTAAPQQSAGDPQHGPRNAKCREKFEGRLYSLFTDPLTYGEAETNCLNHNANLASTLSLAERDFINKFIKECGYTDGWRGDKYGVWIGVHDRLRKYFYMNTDGNKVNFTNWAPGQPDHLNDVEFCGHLRVWPNKPGFGQWNDIQCETRYWSLCKERTC